jgi:hypothetical protein
LLEAANIAKCVEPDFLENVGGVLLVVDQPSNKVVEAIAPAGNELVPRGQVAATAAEDEKLVTDLLAGAFDGDVLLLIR